MSEGISIKGIVMGIIFWIFVYIFAIFLFTLPYFNAGIEKIEKVASNEELIKMVYSQKLETVEDLHYSYPNEGEIVISNMYTLRRKKIVNDENYLVLKVDDKGNVLSREEHYQSFSDLVIRIIIITVVFIVIVVLMEFYLIS